MNASKLSTVERLAEELVARLTIELEASGRHVHLSRADVETLFGAGYRLNRTKDLSQPGQFACAERVTLEGPMSGWTFSASWNRRNCPDGQNTGC